MTSKQVVSNFRVSRDSVNHICLAPFLLRKDTNYRFCLPVDKGVSVTLWKLATKCEYKTIFLDANTIKLGNIPLGSAVDPLEGAPPGTTYTKQTVYELCSCANGKLYLSPAEEGSTCQTTSNFCLWS
ncbi:hypothetical protein GOODEAATRI_013346 [Goodea atripinnis]|uniref:Zeta-sarcoglycan n=1 Tax=Goodea atripinnis TaxID=208336 RepID=A0ABV0PN84_9TELE